MKKIYVLLVGLMCSAAVLAQTTETEWQDANTEIASQDQDVYIEDSGAENNLSDEVLIQIRSDCMAIAESEGIEDDYLVGFVESCITDSIEIELSGNQEGLDGMELPVEEYVEGALDNGEVLSVNEQPAAE